MCLVDNSLEDTYLLGTQSGRNDEGVANLVCMKFFHFREFKKTHHCFISHKSHL